MKKKWSHILMAGVMAVAMVATTACSKADKTDAPAADSAAASTAAEGSAVADAGDIGFPKNETITLVVPGKAGGGSDLGIRYYSEGLNRLYGLKTTVTSDRSVRKAGWNDSDRSNLRTEHPVHHRKL